MLDIVNRKIYSLFNTPKPEGKSKIQNANYRLLVHWFSNRDGSVGSVDPTIQKPEVAVRRCSVSTFWLSISDFLYIKTLQNRKGN